MRRAARVDANQAAIVRDLRKAGVSVLDLSSVGQGAPDLACGFKGRTVLVEIKDGDKPPSAQKLTPQQVAFHNGWQGEAVVVKDIGEALGVFGIKYRNKQPPAD
jgi:Holliday junction resolvase